jgi:hypothetical protein
MWPSAWALAAGGDLVMTPEVEWRAAVGVGLPAAVAPDADASPFALHGPRGPRDLRTPGIDPPGLPHRRNSRGRRLRRVSLAGGRPPPPSCPHHCSEPAPASASEPDPESASASEPESASESESASEPASTSEPASESAHGRLVCGHPRSALKHPAPRRGASAPEGRVSGGGPAGGVTPAGEGLVTNPPKKHGARLGRGTRRGRDPGGGGFGDKPSQNPTGGRRLGEEARRGRDPGEERSGDRPLQIVQLNASVFLGATSENAAISASKPAPSSRTIW